MKRDHLGTLQRYIGVAMLLLVLVLSSTSPANAYSVSVCVDWLPAFDDASTFVGDDWLTSSPTSVDARGILVTVQDESGTAIHAGYASDITGCTSHFEATGGRHQVTAWSIARIHGNTLVLRPLNQPNSLYTTRWLDMEFRADGYYDLNAGNSRMSRVMATVTYAMFRDDLGITGQTIQMYRKASAADEPCAGTSCNTGGEIYLLAESNGVDHTKFKYVIAHEFGHRMMNLAGGISSLPFSYDAPGAGACPGGPGHSRTSVEWQSAAVLEGYAHYYATIVFNTVGGVGCGSYSHVDLDWDNDGVLDGNVYACDDAPVNGLGLSDSDYLGNACGSSLGAGTANEFDYQRFFWDLSDKQPPPGSLSLLPRDIASVIGTASRNPDWNTTYDGSYPGSIDNPRNRLYDAASGFGTTWDVQDDVNGVAR
ncbi:MAG: hypothetical protein R3F59_25575 [Myxococcota bacterium]